MSSFVFTIILFIVLFAYQHQSSKKRSSAIIKEMKNMKNKVNELINDVDIMEQMMGKSCEKKCEKCNEEGKE